MELKEKVIELVNKLRPALQMDGGDMEFVDLIENDTVVLVRLRGACHGCPMSTMTIKGYVEQQITNEIPEIKEVKLAE